MKYNVKLCKILKKEELAKGVFSFVVEAGALAQQAEAGQFANIFVPSKTLRRPISICDIDRENGLLRFVLEIRGEGTAILAAHQEGDCLDILAPLGHGFQLGDTNRKVLFVGGGIGVPPLLYPAKQFGSNATVVLGFRNREAAILAKDFEQAGCRVLIATDDGSLGQPGRVTDCLDGVETEEIFACGPLPMLKALGNVAQEREIPCQISLEERMACGIGACLGCACKTRRTEEVGTEKEVYEHVCKDGPVFDYRRVVF